MSYIFLQRTVTYSINGCNSLQMYLHCTNGINFERLRKGVYFSVNNVFLKMLSVIVSVSISKCVKFGKEINLFISLKMANILYFLQDLSMTSF